MQRLHVASLSWQLLIAGVSAGSSSTYNEGQLQVYTAAQFVERWARQDSQTMDTKYVRVVGAALASSGLLYHGIPYFESTTGMPLACSTHPGSGPNHHSAPTQPLGFGVDITMHAYVSEISCVDVNCKAWPVVGAMTNTTARRSSSSFYFCPLLARLNKAEVGRCGCRIAFIGKRHP